MSPRRGHWTEQHVLDVVINPGYTLGDPPIVLEDAWIAANVRLIERLGPEAYLRRLLQVLRASSTVVVE